MSVAFADALVELLDVGWPRVRRKVDDVLSGLAELVAPDPPLVLKTPSGELVTGLAILNRGRALLFVGVRESGPMAQAPPPTPRDLTRDEALLWERDVDPYRPRS